MNLHTIGSLMIYSSISTYLFSFRSILLNSLIYEARSWEIIMPI